jgi:hypothetical protein
MRSKIKLKKLAAVLGLTGSVAIAGCADPAAPPILDTTTPPENFAPSAVFSTNCNLLDCAFDAAASSDVSVVKRMEQR